MWDDDQHMTSGLVVQESPRWLAWKQRPEAARSAFARLRGGARHIPDELEEIHAVASQLTYGAFQKWGYT